MAYTRGVYTISELVCGQRRVPPLVPGVLPGPSCPGIMSRSCSIWICRYVLQSCIRMSVLGPGLLACGQYVTWDKRRPVKNGGHP